MSAFRSRYRACGPVFRPFDAHIRPGVLVSRREQRLWPPASRLAIQCRSLAAPGVSPRYRHIALNASTPLLPRSIADPAGRSSSTAKKIDAGRCEGLRPFRSVHKKNSSLKNQFSISARSANSLLQPYDRQVLAACRSPLLYRGSLSEASKHTDCDARRLGFSTPLRRTGIEKAVLLRLRPESMRARFHLAFHQYGSIGSARHRVTICHRKEADKSTVPTRKVKAIV